MVRSVRLLRAVLQRSRADWPVVLAAWLLLLGATTLLATGTLYSETVAAGGIRRSILDAPPAARAIVVRTTVPRAEAAGPLDAPIRGAIAESMERTGGEIAGIVRTSSFADATVDPDAVDQVTVLASYEGIERHAELTAGAWPRPAGQAPGQAIEAALSVPAADALSLAVGDPLSLVSRLHRDTAVGIVIAGLFRPDRTDPYWGGDPLELSGIVPSDPYTNVGPVVVTREDLLAVPGRLELQWRALPAIERLQVDDVQTLRVDVELLSQRLRDALGGSRQMTIEAPLPGLLAVAGRSVVVSRSGVTLLTIQFAVLAGYAVVLVGGLLLERRRPEIALLRSRGASSLHLLVMAVEEGFALAIAAVALAPWLALAIVRILAEVGPLAAAGIVTAAEVSQSTILVSAAAGLAGVLALALPTLTSPVGLAGVRAAIGRQTGRTLPQRLGIDLALIAVAAVAIWQLRLYGAPLTQNARGVVGVDPLLVAAPAIGLLGGAVLALRAVPRIAELGERLLVRGRGLVGPLGGRQLSRRPLRYTRAALLLMLASGLGTFATAHAATWTRSQGDQAAYQAAVDLRVVPEPDGGVGGLTAGTAYRGIDGVERAIAVTRQSIDLGRSVRGGPLLALDAATAAAIVSLQPGPAEGATRAALEALAREADEAETALEASVVPVPGEPRRLSVLVDADLRAEPLNEPPDGGVPQTHAAVQAFAVLADGDGRLHRVAGAPGLSNVAGQRLVIDLAPDGGTAVPTWPLRLVSIEVELNAPSFIVLSGTVDLLGIATSDAADGDDWTPLDIGASGTAWRWTRSTPGFLEPYVPPDGNPGRMDVGSAPGGSQPVFPQNPTTFRQVALPEEAQTIPVLAARRFLEATGLEIGETPTGTTFGLELPIGIVGVLEEFPPLDPSQPFVVLDAAGLELNRFALTGQISAPDEWWLDVADGRSSDVAATVQLPPFETDEIVDRVAISRALTGDPVSLGIIGALGLGAVAAMVFAAIGFVVSATVSVSERVGEFALLRALGLSGRQLAVWLSLESAFLLFMGLIAGTALGVLLAWLVLPFATLTETGAPAVPAPIVVVPWQAILPTWLLAVVLLVVTILIVRRQLPSVRISGVLRARDE